MYISRSFLRSLSLKIESRGALVLLIFLLPALAFCLFIAVYAGLSFALLGLPAIVLMLVPFYLPCALAVKREGSVKPVNILLHKNPLEVTSLPVVRNRVYFLYALLPALNIILMIRYVEVWRGIVTGSPVYTFIAIYVAFLFFALMLGKLHYLKTGKFILSIAASLLILVICFCWYVN